MICRPGLAGRLSAMPVACALRGIRAVRSLYQGILPTPLTGHNAAASVNERPAPGRRGASKMLLPLCFAVLALLISGDAIAWPFGAIGIIAPQFSLAASIPVVGAVVIGAVAVAATGYTVYRACSGSEKEKQRGEGQE